MPLLAFALVLLSATLHATWNFLAKRVGGGMTVVWLFTVIGVVVYLPLMLAVLIIEQPTLGLTEFLFIGGTVILHIVYYFLLQSGYRVGDLSLVYPLARGTGPLLTVIGAILLLDERPSVTAFIGALIVTAGIFILTGNVFALRGRDHGPAVAYGLLCGFAIACYTLWDQQAVTVLMIPPVVLIWFAAAAQSIVLTPNAVRNWDIVRHAWANHRRAVIAIGILDLLSYILFLIALRFSDVSLLAPLRQVSILIGAFMGVRLLSEAASTRRLIAAAVMVVGILALTLG